jgi:hypothetical protein
VRTGSVRFDKLRGYPHAKVHIYGRNWPWCLCPGADSVPTMGVLASDMEDGMAIWLNMTGQDASLRASAADGIQKLQGMLDTRRGQGAKIEPDIRAARDTRFVITSRRYGLEEFWLSESAESKKA